MTRYTVVIRPGHDNEKQTNHRTWQSAMAKAHNSSANKDEVEIVETDCDGRSAYDWDGDIIWRE